MGSLNHVLARPDHAFLRAVLGLEAHLDEESDHAAVVRRGLPYYALNPPAFRDLQTIPRQQNGGNCPAFSG